MQAVWPSCAQVATLQHKLKVAEASAEAATKRADQEAEFRVDVAQVHIDSYAL